MASCFIEVDKQPAIEIELFDNSVARKFTTQLAWHIANSSINHREAFYGYAQEDVVRSSLLQSIARINDFLRTEFIKLPQVIDWDDKQLYNHLHESFERLNGEWGRQTRLFYAAPREIKDAIRDLNFSIHRLESRPYACMHRLYLSWDKNTYQREPLAEDDYQHFTDEYRSDWAYLSYVEVGKHLLELYADGLSPNYSAYKNLHYIGAEIDIDWGKPSGSIFSDGFKDWARSHNIDYDDKRLGIGLLPIGRFVGSDQSFHKDSKVTDIRLKIA